MAKVDLLSPCVMYGGPKDVWQGMLDEGFTKVARGGSEYRIRDEVNDQRLVGFCVFYHPDGRVATTEVFKDYTGDATVRDQPTRCDYRNKSALRAHLKKWRAKISPKCSLQQVVDDWE